MIINYEFLGDEPIENVITCMNWKQLQNGSEENTSVKYWQLRIH